MCMLDSWYTNTAWHRMKCLVHTVRACTHIRLHTHTHTHAHTHTRTHQLTELGYCCDILVYVRFMTHSYVRIRVTELGCCW